MKNIKGLAALIRKEFYHILRDPRTVMLIIVMPIVLIYLLGFAMSTDIQNVNMVYMTTSNEDHITRLVNRINNSEYFTVVGRVYNMDEVTHLTKMGKIDAALREDSGAYQIIVDASNPNVGASIGIYLRNILNDFFAEENATPRLVYVSSFEEDTPEMEAKKKAMKEAAERQNAKVAAPTVRMLYNPRLQSSFNFIPGILGLILIIVCSTMTGVSIVREKEMGTMEVLLTSPVRPGHLMIAKTVPYFCLSIVDIAMILVLARFMLGVPLGGNLPLILLFTLLYTFLALAIGLLISILTSSQMAALILCVIVLLIPTLMLSDMMFPIQSMTPFFRGCSAIIPARWYVDAMRKLMIEGLGFGYVIKDFIVLIGMLVVVFGTSLLTFKKRLE